MTTADWQAAQFEDHRTHLRAVAYRMLGSLSEADDAVQDAWIRFSGADTSDVANLRGWLTTVVARVCLNQLRRRRTATEQALPDRLPQPIVSATDALTPEQQVLLADSVGLAMLVVMDTLAPAERVAFVLHDVFGVPFDQIAPILGRTSATTRQLASRARRRIRQADSEPYDDLARQQLVVDAFLAAARNGDLAALVEVLDPEVVLRADMGPVGGGLREVRGAAPAAAQAVAFSALAPLAQRVLVNGAPGLVVVRDGKPYSLLAFSVRDDRIVEIDILGDPARMRELEFG